VRAVVIVLAILTTVSCASVSQKPDGAPQTDSARHIKVCVFNALAIMMSGFTYMPELCAENEMTMREPDL